MELGVKYYLVLKNMMPFTKELNILIVKMVSHIFFPTIIQESKLILMILCLYKKYWLCIIRDLLEQF